MAFGRYFKEINQLDSAKHYYLQAISGTADLSIHYDATRFLYQIASLQNDASAIHKYASMFITVSDSLNLGERQRLAATVNNEFQYYRNQEAERRIKEQSEQRRQMIYLILFSSALIIVSLTAIYNYVRKRQLKIILSKTEELTNLKQDTARKEAELGEARKTLANKEAEIDEINSKLKQYDEELRIKEAQIIEKTQQNQSLMRIWHQTEMEETAEDVITMIRKSATGRHQMTHEDWKKLYHAVDSLHPDFKDSLLQKMGQLKEQQMQVYYLLYIGLTNPEIQNLTDQASTTVWRWSKKYQEKMQNLIVSL